MKTFVQFLVEDADPATIKIGHPLTAYHGTGQNQGAAKDFIPGGISYASHREIALLFGRRISTIDLRGKQFLDLDCPSSPLVQKYDKMLGSNPRQAVSELAALGFNGVRFSAYDEDPNIADDIGEPVYEYRLFPEGK